MTCPGTSSLNIENLTGFSQTGPKLWITALFLWITRDNCGKHNLAKPKRPPIVGAFADLPPISGGRDNVGENCRKNVQNVSPCFPHACRKTQRGKAAHIRVTASHSPIFSPLAWNGKVIPLFPNAYDDNDIALLIVKKSG